MPLVVSNLDGSDEIFQTFYARISDVNGLLIDDQILATLADTSLLYMYWNHTQDTLKRVANNG